MSNDYHATRLAFDERRSVTWKALWRHFFSRRVQPDDCVLDLGCGYGDFINNVVARRRLAVDSWADMPRHMAPGVEPHVGTAWDLGWIEDGAVNLAFASNLFEHLTKDEIARTLELLARKMAPDGRLTLLQPNYRYAYREYFDDFTHVTVFSHTSLTDFLESLGWRVVEQRPRFLPLTVKSRLPVSEWLIALYLALPIKPMAKQMLITAVPPSAEAPR